MFRMSAVVSRNISKVAGGKRILSHITFEANENEIFGVLGPNASGKTTLLRIACTMLIPDEGSCQVFGLDVVKHERAVRRLIGYVSPDLNYHDRFTASEIANFYRRVANVDVERVREILKRCEIANIWNRRWGFLSYGERVLLTFAIALGRHPKILILDEPTANLDAANKLNVSNLLLEERITSLVATHDMGFARKTLGRCIVLNKGKVELSGEIDSLTRKLKFKTAIEAAFDSYQDDKFLTSLSYSYRRKPKSFDVTFYLDRDDEKLELIKQLASVPSLRGMAVSEPSVEDLIFWVKLRRSHNEKSELA